MNNDEELIIEPGDLIFVKKQQQVEEFWFYLARVSAIATIFGGLATIYLAYR